MAKKAAPKKKVEKKDEYSIEDLQKLAEDINGSELFEDQIDLEEVEDLEEAIDLIKETIVEDDVCQIYTTDSLSKTSFATLELIGCAATVPDDEEEAATEEEAEEEAPAEEEEKPKKKAAPKKNKKADEDEDDSEERMNKKEEKPKKKSSGTKKGNRNAFKGPGVIAAIIDLIKEQGPITKEQILKELVKKFPDRNEASMKTTINVQVPNRINKERDFKVVSTEDGYKVAKK